MKPLVKIEMGQIMAGGLFPGVTPNQDRNGLYQPIVWTGGRNVLFTNQGVSKMLGYTTEATEAAAITGLAQAFVNGERRVYVGSKGKIRKWLSGASTDLTPIGGFSATGVWSMVPLGTQVVATNFVDPPQIWKNTALFVPLGGVAGIFSRVRLFKSYKNFLMAYGTDNSGQEVKWSDVSAPEVWTPAPENKAGGLILRDIASDIIAVQPIAGAMAIYTSDEMMVQGFTGGQDVFSFDLALRGIGAVSDSSVVPVGRMHYGLGPNGFWQTDGTTYKYLDDPAVQTYYFDNADLTKVGETTAFHYKLRKLVQWFFPCKDGVIRGLGYHYATGAWTIAEAPVVASLDEVEFQWPLVATGSAFGFYDKVDGANLTATFNADLYTGHFDAQQPERFKRWDLLRTELYDQVGPMQVRFGFSDKPVDWADITDWTGWGVLSRETYIGRESPYLTVGFRTLTKGDEWRMGGFTLLGEVTAWRV